MYSGYIWKEYAKDYLKGTLSVRLEQVKVRDTQLGFFFIVMSEDTSLEGIENSGNCCCDLVQWFHKKVLLRFQNRKNRKLHKKYCDEMYEFLEEYCKKRRNLHIGFILTMDNHIWYRCRGEVDLYLVNRRYSKGQIKKLEPEAEGTMQRGVGLFMSTTYLLEGANLQEICDLLLLGKGRTGKNVDNRMRNVEEIIDSVPIQCKENGCICEEKGAIFVFYE